QRAAAAPAGPGAGGQHQGLSRGAWRPGGPAHLPARCRPEQGRQRRPRIHDPAPGKHVMKRYLWLAALPLACGLAEAGTLRCGSKLVNEGDRAFEVERKCGTPAHRDLVGYTGGVYGDRELVIEEWVY